MQPKGLLSVNVRCTNTSPNYNRSREYPAHSNDDDPKDYYVHCYTSVQGQPAGTPEF